MSWTIRWLALITFVAVFAACGGGGEEDGGIAPVQPTGDTPWTPNDDPAPPDGNTPETAQGFDLDVDAFSGLIESMGVEHELTEDNAQEVIVPLPLPDGSLESYSIHLVKQRSDELARENPDIFNFAGQGVDAPQNTLRGTWTPFGLHCTILHEKGTVIIRTLDSQNPSQYEVHWMRDDTTLIADLPCLTEAIENAVGGHTPAPSTTALTLGGTIRTYNIAFAVASELTVWANANAGSINALVNIILSDVNLVYGRDVAMQFVMVGLSTPADPDDWAPPAGASATNAEVTAWFIATQNRLETDFGVGSFDIGHFLCLNFGLGGVAQQGGCQANSAYGISSASGATPANQLGYRIRVCHEMGHQLGAGHTWSANCLAGQFAAASACEPGSGTTILSYGHNCSGDATGEIETTGIGRHLSFHACSIAQLDAYAAGGGSCFVGTVSANGIPSVTSVPADTTIPMGTPFVLTATGTDPDGDPLQWTWDQIDLAGPTRDLCTVDDGMQPLFRTFAPATDANVRVFPAMSVLLADERDTCSVNGLPGTRGEQLPTSARILTFQATARDAVPGGGGSDCDDVVLTVDAATGPFEVTSPNGGETWGEGTTQTITWDVAGSDGAPINTANVAIELSIDGFMTVTTLSASTPNDGTEDVMLPICEVTTTARIRVRALGNVYFDISDADFEIEDSTPPTVTLNIGRGLLWSPRQGLMDVTFNATALDNCDPLVNTFAVAVYSNTDHGAAPYTPDADYSAASPDRVRLRAERIIPGGRVYLIVVRATDANGNDGFACRSVVVPDALTAAAVLSVINDGNAAIVECQAPPGGVLPVGYFTLFPFTPIP